AVAVHQLDCPLAFGPLGGLTADRIKQYIAIEKMQHYISRLCNWSRHRGSPARKFVISARIWSSARRSCPARSGSWPSFARYCLTSAETEVPRSAALTRAR